MTMKILNNEKQVGNALKVPSNMRSTVIVSLGYSSEYSVTSHRLIDEFVDYQTI
jgi:hypothetical protein